MTVIVSAVWHFLFVSQFVSVFFFFCKFVRVTNSVYVRMRTHMLFFYLFFVSQFVYCDFKFVFATYSVFVCAY